jgi:hypothetical protein
VTNAAIAVATSIAPKNIELQRAAIDTWLARGLRVLSINCGAEVPILAPQFPSVEFVDVGELDTQHTRRKLVYFDQLLTALKASGAPVCAIVNSDIHLRGGNDLTMRIADLASQGLLFGARTDVTSVQDASGAAYLHGFDFFFFARSVIDIYPASPFRLGAPWWDLWAPLVPLVRGIKVMNLAEPIAMHVRHDSTWSQEQEWQTYGALFMDAVKTLAGGGWVKAEPADSGDVWRAFYPILADAVFAHHRLLERSIEGQDPTTQALIQATNHQTALVVGQAMRTMLAHVVPIIRFGAAA